MAISTVFGYSSTAASNTDVAGNGITGSSSLSLGNDAIQNIMAQIASGVVGRGSDIATAGTLSFDGASTPSVIHDLTGTTTVTAITLTAGQWRLARAQGAFTLTASSTLVVNGSTSASYTTTAGDLLVVFAYSASTVRVWTITGGALAGVTTATASTVAARDSSANLLANNLLTNYATTATAAGTTTLTVASAYRQFFTGSSTQTVVLPVTSTLVLGFPYRITNNSTGAVTVQSSGANNILVLPAGTSADFTCILTSGTTAASWNANFVRGGLELLTSGTVSAAATLDIVLTSYTGYRGIKIVLYDLFPATNAVNFYMRLSTNGGGTYLSAGYSYVGQCWDVAAVSNAFGSGSAAQIQFINGSSISTTAGTRMNLDIDLLGQTSAKFPAVTWKGTYQPTSTGLSLSGAASYTTTAQDTDAVRFLFSSGNIASGTYAVYGYV